jgi:hypothetical protein
MPAKNILSARLGGELWYRRAQVLAFLSILAEVPTGIFTSVPTRPARSAIRETSRRQQCWVRPSRVARSGGILPVQA